MIAIVVRYILGINQASMCFLLLIESSSSTKGCVNFLQTLASAELSCKLSSVVWVEVAMTRFVLLFWEVETELNEFIRRFYVGEVTQYKRAKSNNKQIPCKFIETGGTSAQKGEYNLRSPHCLLWRYCREKEIITIQNVASKEISQKILKIENFNNKKIINMYDFQHQQKRFEYDYSKFDIIDVSCFCFVVCPIFE